MIQTIDTMTVRDAIYGRCSVRSYLPDPVDRATLDMLMAAAVRAPTAMHVEPWQFVIVQDTALLARLSERAKAAFSVEANRLHPDRGSLDPFSQPDFNVFYDAGTLILICARSATHFEQADCWLAAENLMLAAYAMGLGSCVIGSAVSVFNMPDVKRELGMPSDSTAVAPIIVGKPRGETLPTTRNEPEVLAWR
ncbi:MAG: nitroreductase family protein [Zoogloea sp.]|nr:nitroreductase family protein [Zoogloea sp.]